MPEKIEFVQGEIFHREENNHVEFKKIESQQPVKKIIKHSEEYIIGFLNASVEGDLYFGIDDELRQQEANRIESWIGQEETL